MEKKEAERRQQGGHQVWSILSDLDKNSDLNRIGVLFSSVAMGRSAIPSGISTKYFMGKTFRDIYCHKA